MNQEKPTTQTIQNKLDQRMKFQRQNIIKAYNGDKTIFSRKEIMEIYTDVYNFLVELDQKHPGGEEMYKLFCKYNTNFLNDSVQIVKQTNEQNLIDEILTQEQLYQYNAKNLIKYFNYLDRSFVELSAQHFVKLAKKVKMLFFEDFYSRLEYNIRTQFLYELRIERLQKDKEIQLKLKQLFTIINEMKEFYEIIIIDNEKKHIGQDIIDETIKYFDQSYIEITKNNQIVEKIRKLRILKKDELERINCIFASNQKIKEQLIDLLGTQIREKLLQEVSEEKDEQIQILIDYQQFKDFSELIDFFDNLKNIQTADKFLKKFKSIIIQKGENIIKEKKEPKIEIKSKEDRETLQLYQLKYIEQFIELQQYFINIIDQYCNRNIHLQNSLTQAMEQITNQDLNFIMESILQFFKQYILKKMERDTEKKLIQIITLIQCIQQKDLLLQNYQQNCARRLLININADIDKEKQVLDQFRKICGPDYTKRLENMLRDFSQQQNQKPIIIGGIEIKSKIFNIEFWPETQPQILLNNHQLNELKEAYQQQFLQEHTTNSLKTLSWQDQLSMMDIKFETNQEYTITIGSVGGAILLEFNYENQPKSIQEISQILKVDQLHLEKQVKLMLKRGLLIAKEDLQQQTYIQFNEQFSNRLRKVPVGFVLEEKIMFQQEDMDQDRKAAIQAAIVRVMKSRKQQTFFQLYKEVKENLKMFRPKDQDIKQVIEGLIDLEYLKRNPQNHGELFYVS